MDNVIIGQSVVITGELTAKEDLTIDGLVDGKIELGQNVLTIGQNAPPRMCRNAARAGVGLLSQQGISGRVPCRLSSTV